MAIDQLIHLAQKRNGLQIFVAAVLVGNPLAVFARIIQIQHGSNGINAQAVNMKFLKPIQSAGAKEIAHLVATVVINFRPPVAVFSFARIGMFIQMGTVKLVQAVAVFGEVGGNPVHDDADAGLVELVNQITQIVRRTETAGGSKHSYHLISPGTIKRVLAEGQKFDVGKAHVGYIRNQRIGQFAIGHKLVVFFAPP